MDELQQKLARRRNLNEGKDIFSSPDDDSDMYERTSDLSLNGRKQSKEISKSRQSSVTSNADELFQKLARRRSLNGEEDMNTNEMEDISNLLKDIDLPGDIENNEIPVTAENREQIEQIQTEKENQEKDENKNDNQQHLPNESRDSIEDPAPALDHPLSEENIENDFNQTKTTDNSDKKDTNIPQPEREEDAPTEQSDLKKTKKIEDFETDDNFGPGPPPKKAGKWYPGKYLIEGTAPWKYKKDRDNTGSNSNSNDNSFNSSNADQEALNGIGGSGEMETKGPFPSNPTNTSITQETTILLQEQSDLITILREENRKLKEELESLRLELDKKQAVINAYELTNPADLNKTLSLTHSTNNNNDERRSSAGQDRLASIDTAAAINQQRDLEAEVRQLLNSIAEGDLGELDVPEELLEQVETGESTPQDSEQKKTVKEQTNIAATRQKIKSRLARLSYISRNGLGDERSIQEDLFGISEELALGGDLNGVEGASLNPMSHLDSAQFNPVNSWESRASAGRKWTKNSDIFDATEDGDSPEKTDAVKSKSISVEQERSIVNQYLSEYDKNFAPLDSFLDIPGEEASPLVRLEQPSAASSLLNPNTENVLIRSFVHSTGQQRRGERSPGKSGEKGVGDSALELEEKRKEREEEELIRKKLGTHGLLFGSEGSKRDNSEIGGFKEKIESNESLESEVVENSKKTQRKNLFQDVKSASGKNSSNTAALQMMNYQEFLAKFTRCIGLVNTTRKFMFTVLGPNGDATPPEKRKKLDYVFYGVDQLEGRCRDFFDEMQLRFTDYPDFKNESEERIFCARDCLEQYVMCRLADFAFRTVECKEEDNELVRRMKILLFLEPQVLDIKPEVFDETLLAIAGNELRRINAFKTPGDKIACVVKCAGIIFRCLNLSRAKLEAEQNETAEIGQKRESATPAGADDFLPLFIWVVMRSHIPNLVSNCEYIQNYLNPARIMGKQGYCLINLRSAVEFVLHIDPEGLNIEADEFYRKFEEAERELE